MQAKKLKSRLLGFASKSVPIRRDLVTGIPGPLPPVDAGRSVPFR